MRKQKQRRGCRSKPMVSRIVIKVMPGEKLLWQRSDRYSGWDLNLVDASVQ